MPKCYYCGEEFPSLRLCSHCEQNYCGNHSEPNQHDCPLTPIQNPFEISQTHPSTQTSSSYSDNLSPTVAPSSSSNIYTDGSYYWHRKPDQEDEVDAFDPDSGVKIPGILFPKLSEVLHIIIASVLILSLSISGFISQNLDIIQIAFLSLMYLIAFLSHEFAHRQTAVHYGLQTKFRLFTMGVIMTVVCIFLPVKFALPGAVVVLGLENISRETGLIKLAGPLANLVLGTLLFILGIVPLFNNTWRLLIMTGANFNFMLGAFNMLPFGILDGDNIRKWNPRIWLLFFLLLIALLALTLVITTTNLVIPLS